MEEGEGKERGGRGGEGRRRSWWNQRKEMGRGEGKLKERKGRKLYWGKKIGKGRTSKKRRWVGKEGTGAEEERERSEEWEQSGRGKVMRSQ